MMRSPASQTWRRAAFQLTVWSLRRPFRVGTWGWVCVVVGEENKKTDELMCTFSGVKREIINHTFSFQKIEYDGSFAGQRNLSIRVLLPDCLQP